MIPHRRLRGCRVYSVSEWPDFSDSGSERSDLGSERSDLRSERPDLRLLGGGRRNTSSEKNCPVWNHRSSAPPRPLPKNEFMR